MIDHTPLFPRTVNILVRFARCAVAGRTPVYIESQIAQLSIPFANPTPNRSRPRALHASLYDFVRPDACSLLPLVCRELSGISRAVSRSFLPAASKLSDFYAEP
jgi:hypothetical protein